MGPAGTYQDIADRLVKDGYLLTALELHAELAERGKGLRSLKEFFEDQANFEKFVRTWPAAAPSSELSSSALSNFDESSLLDLMTRQSEEGSSTHNVHGEADRVAVLEFELRKANQTINTLRSELTQQASSSSSVVKVDDDRNGDPETDEHDGSSSHLRQVSRRRSDFIPAAANDDEDNDGEGSSSTFPDDANSSGAPILSDVVDPLGHEKRALNYLVNEYLLQQGCRLTSITFSDENSAEDFEDWDTIGLNVPKPPNLARIYREFQNSFASCAPKWRTTSLQPSGNEAVPKAAGSGASFNLTTTVGVEVGVQCDGGPSGQRPEDRLLDQGVPGTVEEGHSSHGNLDLSGGESGDHRGHQVAKLGSSSRKGSSPDSLEIMVDELEVELDLRMEPRTIEPRTTLAIPTTTRTPVALCPDLDRDSSGRTDPDPEEVRPQDLPPLFRHLEKSCREFRTTTLQPDLDKDCGDDGGDPNLEDDEDQGGASNNELLSHYYMSASTFLELVDVVAKCLPEIVPHVLLARRGTVMPLLLVAIGNHPRVEVRDDLLSLLFNLTKRPSPQTRAVIVRGFLQIASGRSEGHRRGGQTDDVVGQSFAIEAELLPQLWQQVEHRYPERRLLVAETCLALIRYVPADIRDSLVFSILLQLASQDKDFEVRRVAIFGMGVLTLHMQNFEKIKGTIANELLPEGLAHPSDQVFRATMEGLLPCVALRLCHEDSDGGEECLRNLALRTLSSLLLGCGTLERLEQSLDSRTSGSSAALNNPTSNPNPPPFAATSNQVNTLRAELPFLMYLAIKHAPMSNKDEVSGVSQGPAASGAPVATFTMLFRDAAEAEASRNRFWYQIPDEPEKCLVVEEEEWPQLVFLSSTLVDDLFRAVSKIQVAVPDREDLAEDQHQVWRRRQQRRLVLDFVALFRDLAVTMGSAFTRRTLQGKLEQVLSLPMEAKATNEDVVLAVGPHSSGLVPVYFLGTLATLMEPRKLCEVLKDWCTGCSLHGLSTDALVFTMKEFLLSGNLPTRPTGWILEFRDALAEAAWSLVVHPSAKVKVFAGLMLDILASSDLEESSDLISTKILPGLVTLSSDLDLNVQRSAVSGLGSIILTGFGRKRTSGEIREKAYFQLVSWLMAQDNDDPANQGTSSGRNLHQIYVQVAETIWKIIRSSSSLLVSPASLSSPSNNSHFGGGFDLQFVTFRDEMLLPKLALIACKYSAGSRFGEAKSLEALAVLLKIYRTLVLDIKLPAQTVNEHLRPGLRRIAADFHRLGTVAQESACHHLLDQLDKEYGHSSRSWPGGASISPSPAGPPPLPLSGGVSTSTSMEDVKLRMGKIFQRPSQSFWKKQ